MSSILDALNKLEQEKAQAHSEARGFDPNGESGAQDLLGRDILRDRVTLRFSPLSIIVGGMIAVITIAALSVTAALTVFRPVSSGSTALASSAPRVSPEPAPESAPVVLPPQENTAEREESPSAAVAEPPPEESQASIVPATATSPESPNEDPSETPEDISEDASKADAIVTAPPPKEPKPAPTPRVVAKVSKPVPAAEPPRPDPVQDTVTVPASRVRIAQVPVSAARAPSIPDPEPLLPHPEGTPTIPSLWELPILTVANQTRYADGELKINMVTPKSDKYPRGYAIINKVKVYEGQRISRTRLTLFKVEGEGIGVQVTTTDERFFIPY